MQQQDGMAPQTRPTVAEQDLIDQIGRLSLERALTTETLEAQRSAYRDLAEHAEKLRQALADASEQLKAAAERIAELEAPSEAPSDTDGST